MGYHIIFPKSIEIFNDFFTLNGENEDELCRISDISGFKIDDGLRVFVSNADYDIKVAVIWSVSVVIASIPPRARGVRDDFQGI